MPSCPFYHVLPCPVGTGSHLGHRQPAVCVLHLASWDPPGRFASRSCPYSAQNLSVSPPHSASLAPLFPHPILATPPAGRSQALGTNAKEL